jgi:hypothetical protein
VTDVSSTRSEGIGLILAGGLLVVASFMPWASVQTLLGTVSYSGVDGNGDGIITLVAGFFVGLMGAALARKASPAAAVVGFLAGGGALWVFVVNHRRVGDLIADLDTNVAIASVGYGLWLVGAGAVAGMTIALLAVRKRSGSVTPADPDPGEGG